MRHRSITSRAGKVMLGAVLAGALSGVGASIAQATLTLDLEPKINGTQYTPANPDDNVTVSAGTTSLPIEVYAVVTDPANSGPGGDGLGGLFASFDATGSALTASTSGLQMELSTPGTFDYLPAASTGTGYTYTDSTGAVHNGVGNLVAGTTSTTPAYDSTTPNNWVFAAYLFNSDTSVGSIYNGGQALPGGAYYDLGTLTLSLNGSAANGSTATVTGYGRTQQSGSPFVAALWTEGTTVETPSTSTFEPTSNALEVTVGTVGPPPPTHNPGDVNDDGIVNQLDLNVITSHWQSTDTPGLSSDWENGDLNEDGVVNQLDLNMVTGNWQTTYSDYAGVVVAPEPASLGLLGLAALGLVRRRK